MPPTAVTSLRKALNIGDDSHIINSARFNQTTGEADPYADQMHRDHRTNKRLEMHGARPNAAQIQNKDKQITKSPLQVGGKKSRRKRTKRRRTTGGKKSRRRLRKRTTLKGGKRKRRRTRRRR